MQNIRRSHNELRADEPTTLRVAAAFDELALADLTNRDQRSRLPRHPTTQQTPSPLKWIPQSCVKIPKTTMGDRWSGFVILW